MHLKSCVAPEGCFSFSIHKPTFKSKNLRRTDHIKTLGAMSNGQPITNLQNFPQDNVAEDNADWIYEIANPFPFRGVTYIGKRWADRAAKAPHTISLEKQAQTSLSSTLENWLQTENEPSPQAEALFTLMPRAIQLALAVTSTDPRDLVRLAHISGRFIYEDDQQTPKGMVFRTGKKGTPEPEISDLKLFEAVANNPYLPVSYKKVMVLNPGIQGNSEIVGEWFSEDNASHVFEYLRRNSYIPYGHYAANMAHDAIRYEIKEILAQDIAGMRHLYYQRTYVRLAEQLNITLSFSRRPAPPEELESLRQEIISILDMDGCELAFDRTLWGWNFGFDFAPSGYRMHASHQQVHQQFAMIPKGFTSEDGDGSQLTPYACGDLIAVFIEAYRQQYGIPFFQTYEQAIRSNRRMDGKPDGPQQLVVYEDDQVLLFVPKAQTSQWELQLMPKASVANILLADGAMRKALDQAIWMAMRTLGAMGAKMITIFEYSGKISTNVSDQRLLYAFLPRLPESPGAFSEAQLRWINGHYPEDFAAACRQNLP